MRKLGNLGERSARKYLKRCGYQILDNNYTIRGAELDIVAKDKETLVFVEVKSRKNNKFGNPSEFVNYKKQTKIIQAAKHYIHTKNFYDMPARFDVVEVIGDINCFGIWKVCDINHIKDAFRL